MVDHAPDSSTPARVSTAKIIGFAYLKLGDWRDDKALFRMGFNILSTGRVHGYFSQLKAHGYTKIGVAYCTVEDLNNFWGYLTKCLLDSGRAHAIELDPEDSSACNNRGNAYGELEDYDRAIKDHDRAIELNPEDALAYNNRGYTYYRLDAHETAIKDFDRVIELDPEDASAYIGRGSAYTELGARDGAADGGIFGIGVSARRQRAQSQNTVTNISRKSSRAKTRGIDKSGREQVTY